MKAGMIDQGFTVINPKAEKDYHNIYCHKLNCTGYAMTKLFIGLNLSKF